MQTFLDSNRKRLILAVDDEIINREILKEILTQSYDVVFASNGAEAMEILSDPEADFSLVMLDLKMPVMDGFEVLTRMKSDERLRKFPVIIMTGDKNSEVKSLKMGAADFITKPFDMPEVILARCQVLIELSEDRSIIRSTERDPVTGLYSKEFFFVYIRRLLLKPENKMDALVINLDGLSHISDLFGLVESSRILKMTAKLINDFILQSHGIACRTDDDAFYIYCEHKDDYEASIRKIQDIINKETPVRLLRLHGGLYEPKEDDELAQTWFDRAKAACENTHDSYDICVGKYNRKLYEKTLFEQRLISDIDEAIEKKQFTVYYQPKYNIQGEKPQLRSAEALVRWMHPKLGFISPGDFIPLFESNGLIRKIDRFVWREAAKEVRKIKDVLKKDINISVNVSRIDIFDPELEDVLLDIINEYDLSPKNLILEITESAYANNDTRLIEVISSLRHKGFKIEMDDFGSGYSSLNMLATLPIDVLKLDMKFVQNMLIDEKCLKLVELVIDLVHFLEIPIVAEGVEKERQLKLLKDMGCDVIQGYYFSPPLPQNEFEQLIQNKEDHTA